MTPGTYTHGHAEPVLRSHRWRTATNSAAYLLPHLRPGLSLLDIGCGPGTITADLARLVTPGEVTAIDVTEEALRGAREEAARRQQAGITFRLGDVHSLDLPDDSVSTYTSTTHVSPDKVLPKLARMETAATFTTVASIDAITNPDAKAASTKPV